VDFYFDRNISGFEQIVSITFFGGEPMLELERMSEVVARAREKGPKARKLARFTATTNGTIATPDVERIVRDASMALLISLDGTSEQNAHRPFVSGRATYHAVARNLPKLISWAPVSVVRMTYHPDALDLVGNVRHMLELGAPAIALCPVDESPWHQHQERLDAAFDELATWFVSEARADRLPPLEVTHMLLRQLHAARQGAPRPSRSCSVATGLIGIDPDGNVMPCQRFLYRPQDWLGHVDTPELSSERWKYVHLASSTLLGCDGCSARLLCGGGCRAVVLDAGGDLHTGTSPGYCLTTRAHARACEAIYDTLMSENNPALVRLLQGPLPATTALTQLAIQ
jgi:uncharacterized protein